MRLLCLHEDTVQALQRLGTAVDDLTPRGLWNTPYHLVSMSPEQRDALQRLRVSMDDITPTALRDGGGVAAMAGTSQASLGTAARTRLLRGDDLRTAHGLPVVGEAALDDLDDRAAPVPVRRDAAHDLVERLVHRPADAV